MALQRIAQAEADRGEEFVFQAADADNGKPVKLWIRRAPKSIRLGLTKRHKLDLRKQVNGVPQENVEGNSAYVRDLAAWAALRAENVSIVVDDQHYAALYGGLLGQTLAPGDVAVFDEAFGKEEVRRQLFEDVPALAVWVVQCVSKLDAQADEIERGKGQN